MKNFCKLINIFDFDRTLITDTWPKCCTLINKYGYEGRKKESQDNMNAQKEKEDIQIVVSMVMFGENSINELTYDGLNEQLKIKFGEGIYKLSGPDDKGNYTIKINYGTYKH